MLVRSQPRVFYVTARGQSAKSFLVRHLEGLSQSGFEPFLVCSDDAPAHDVARVTGITHLAIPLKAEISLLSDVGAVIKLARHIRRIRPAAVHAHMSKAGLASMLASWAMRVPVRIYHNHGMACFSSTGLSRWILMTVERVNCTLATDIIFCSNSTRELAIELGICTSAKSMVIGKGTISGVDTQRFSPQSAAIEADQLRSTISDASSGKRYIGFVGRVVAHKGVDTLISAWALLPAEFRSKWTLLVAGSHNSDGLYSRLDALVRNDESVQYLGRLDNVVGLYGLLDALVLPSWHEGFPYSVLEAQACGVPAIVTDVTGNRDAVIDEVTGSLVEVRSPDSLAISIENLLSDDALLEKMSISARDRVVKDFNEEVVLANLLTFYNEKVAA